MKKIAYIELDTHAEIAGNFMELMNNSKEFEVDYYFSDKILKLLNLKENQEIFKSDKTQINQQISTQNYDLVILGTVHRYFNLFNVITEKFNTSIIVHNLNFAKISRFQLFKNIFKKDFKYRLKLWLKEDLLSAPDVFKKAKNLLVLDQSLIKKNAEFNLKFLPIFFLKEYDKPRNSIITIVIPGTVSQERRDYHHVFETIKKFKIESHIQFIFLGKAENKELILLKNLKKNLPQNLSIRYFEEKIPQNTFDEWMNEANILWCPIQNETEFFSNKEIYGKTKMSGNIGDAIKFGKQAVFPKDYISQYSFLIPQIDDVEKQILHCHKDLEYDFNEKFNQKKVAAELEEILKSLL